MRILVVCTGNICRSPMGEIVLRERFKQGGFDVDVDSVGVSDEESGRPVDSRAAKVLREAGYDVPRRAARQVTPADLADSDLVLAMTVGHARQLKKVAEGNGIDPSVIHLWSEFDDNVPLPIAPHGAFGPGGVLEGKEKAASGYSVFYSSDGEWDVPDPWYGGEDGFYDTLSAVESGADGILAWVRDNGR